MSIEFLSDEIILSEISEMAAHGRAHTRRFLNFLVEVDRRKLYLKLAFSSLFEFLTEALLYSSGSAQRRIDATRLLQVVPEVSEKIESGAIKLSQISKVQAFCRQMKRDSGETLHRDFQRSILQKIENKNAQETDLILAQEFQTELKIKERRFIQADESVRVEFTFSKVEMAVIEQAQNILSNKTGGTLKETFLEMARKLVKSIEPKNPTAKVAVKQQSSNPKTIKTVEQEDDDFHDSSEIEICPIDLGKSRAHLFDVSQLESRGDR